MSTALEELEKQVKEQQLVTVNEGLCVIEKAKLIVEGNSPLSWCTYTKDGGKEINNKKYIALEVPNEVTTVRY
jgi:hypothetical protein